VRQPAQKFASLPPIHLDRASTRLADRVRRMSGTELRGCYQCRTCSGGCPFFQAMDYGPHGVMRLLQLGQLEELLTCNTIWLCVGCHTCSACCPMAIDIAAVMDALRRLALSENAKVAEPGVLAFHREVLRAIESYGRTHKLEIMLRFKAGQKQWFQDFDVGLKMLAKRKLPLLPSKIERPQDMKRLFNKHPRHKQRGIGGNL